MYEQLIANDPIFKIMTESSFASVNFWCLFRKSVYSNLLGTFFFFSIQKKYCVPFNLKILQTSVSDFIYSFSSSFFLQYTVIGHLQSGTKITLTGNIALFLVLPQKLTVFYCLEYFPINEIKIMESVCVEQFHSYCSSENLPNT